MKTIEKVLKLGTLFSSAGFICSVIIQIYARFLMESAPSWTEEASRFFFVFTMSFAAGLAMKDKEYVQLDLIYNKLSEGAKKRLDISIAIFIGILMIVMGAYAVDYIILGWPEKSPSLGYPMALAFTSIFVMSISIGIYVCHDLINSINRKI